MTNGNTSGIVQTRMTKTSPNRGVASLVNSSDRAYAALGGGEGAVIHNRNIVADVSIRGHSLANAIVEPLGAFEWVALSYLGFSGALMADFS